MLKGLVNSKGHRVAFEDLAKNYRREDWRLPDDLSWSTGGAWPLAFLVALGRDNREPDKVHISTLLNAPLREILKKREPYYLKPDDLLFIADGSAFHAWLAEYGGLPAENRYDMKVDLGAGTSVIVTGEPDHAEHGGQLIDHKRMQVYSLKKCLENGHAKERPEQAWQLRFYNVLLKANGIVVEPPFKIFVWASNWQKAFRNKQQDPRMAEFDVYPTPHDEEELASRARAYIMASTMAVAGIPPCADREAFGKVKGKQIPRRCQDYCEVNQFCPFYAKLKKGMLA